MKKLIFIFLLLCANCFAQNYIGKNPTAQGNINSGGFSITNAGSISATNTLTIPNIVTTNLTIGGSTITNPYKLLFSQTNSVGISNTVSETTLLTTNGFGSLDVAGNVLSGGKAVRVTACGFWGTANTNQTLLIKLKFGSGNIIAQTTAQACPTNMGNTNFWMVRGIMNCLDSGNVITQGSFENNQATTALFSWPMINTSSMVLDLSVTNTFDLTATWSRANTNNTITTTSAVIEKLN